MRYALLFSSPAQADEARSSLEAEGHEVDLQEQADGAVVLVAVPPEKASHETLVIRMQSLAEELGGDFMGYGGLSSVGLG